MQDPRAGWVRRQLGGGASEPPAAAPGRPDPQPVISQTFIHGGAELEGTLRLHGAFRIDTEFRGAIVSDAAVVVGEDAGIEASIQAREVEIRGAVVGDVVASRQVVLRAGARLHGDIRTPSIEIERGAFFNGRTEMVRPQAAVRPRAAPAARADAAPDAAREPDAPRSAREARSAPSGPAGARPPS